MLQRLVARRGSKPLVMSLDGGLPAGSASFLHFGTCCCLRPGGKYLAVGYNKASHTAPSEPCHQPALSYWDRPPAWQDLGCQQILQRLTKKLEGVELQMCAPLLLAPPQGSYKHSPQDVPVRILRDGKPLLLLPLFCLIHCQRCFFACSPNPVFTYGQDLSSSLCSSPSESPLPSAVTALPECTPCNGVITKPTWGLAS